MHDSKHVYRKIHVANKTFQYNDPYWKHVGHGLISSFILLEKVKIAMILEVEQLPYELCPWVSIVGYDVLQD